MDSFRTEVNTNTLTFPDFCSCSVASYRPSREKCCKEACCDGDARPDDVHPFIWGRHNQTGQVQEAVNELASSSQGAEEKIIVVRSTMLEKKMSSNAHRPPASALGLDYTGHSSRIIAVDTGSRCCQADWDHVSQYSQSVGLSVQLYRRPPAVMTVPLTVLLQSQSDKGSGLLAE